MGIASNLLPKTKTKTKNRLNNVMLYLMTDRSRLQKNISIG
jgi:hypothetical protein